MGFVAKALRASSRLRCLRSSEVGNAETSGIGALPAIRLLHSLHDHASAGQLKGDGSFCSSPLVRALQKEPFQSASQPRYHWAVLAACLSSFGVGTLLGAEWKHRSSGTHNPGQEGQAGSTSSVDYSPASSPTSSWPHVARLSTSPYTTAVPLPLNITQAPFPPATPSLVPANVGFSKGQPLASSAALKQPLQEDSREDMGLSPTSVPAPLPEYLKSHDEAKPLPSPAGSDPTSSTRPYLSANFIADAAAKASPAVVNITVSSERGLLDMATNGGQWEPILIETARAETNLESAKQEALIGSGPPEAKPAETPKEGEGRNWKVLIGLFFAFCLMTSADKAAMSVAPMSMAKQFGWLESDKGLIGSSFFLGFMFSQIPSSIVCKKIGRRKVMTGVALWIAACQLLTPLAASTFLTGLLAVRAALGFGEGVVVPILTSMLADYVPAEKRSSSLAMVFSGGPLGTVLSLFLCPTILQNVGWQPLFYAVGVVSLAWGAAWSFAAPHFDPIPTPKPRWNPFRKTPKTTVAPEQKTAPTLAASNTTFKLYKDSPLLLETGVKLATLAALGPDGKRIPATEAAVARPGPEVILNGAVLNSFDDEELVFSPDDPYWKLAPDARRKLRQRRIAIRGRFNQNGPANSPPKKQTEHAQLLSSPRKHNGIALPVPHSAQQSLAGSSHVAASPSVLSPIPAEATVSAARRRAGAPHLRPLRSTGTVCSSAAVSEALVADASPAGASAAPAGGIPWRRFFASRAFWAIAGAHFCSNWGWNAFMAWLPTYFTQKLGLDLAASSTITLIPWTMAFLAGNTSGMLADWMSGLGIHKTKVRKIIQAIAFLGPATGLALLTRVSSATEAVAVFCGILAMGSFSAGGFCSNHSDISPKHSGTLYALTNTFGCLGGSASVALTGVLLDKTGNWNIVWLGAAFMYVIGTLWYVALGSTEKEFE